MHELHEEAGYIIAEKQLIPLGTCYGTKSSDTVYYLYSVDLTDEVQGEATGDGSELEKQASCFWSTAIDNSKDPMVYTAYHRLITHLNELENTK